jgi:hypothetical protein
MCLDQPYGFYVVAAVLVTALNKAVMLALVDTSLFARWLCLCSLGQLAWSRLLCTKLAGDSGPLQQQYFRLRLYQFC